MTIDFQQLDALDSNAKRELLARMLKKKAAGVGETIELSLGQEALYFLNELSPQAISYNVAFCGRIRAQVDSDRLEAALLKLLERHTALRCTFPPSAEKQKAALPRLSVHPERRRPRAADHRSSHRLRRLVAGSYSVGSGASLRSGAVGAAA